MSGRSRMDSRGQRCPDTPLRSACRRHQRHGHASNQVARSAPVARHCQQTQPLPAAPVCAPQLERELSCPPAVERASPPERGACGAGWGVGQAVGRVCGGHRRPPGRMAPSHPASLGARDLCLGIAVAGHSHPPMGAGETARSGRADAQRYNKAPVSPATASWEPSTDRGCAAGAGGERGAHQRDHRLERGGSRCSGRTAQARAGEGRAAPV